MNKFKFKIKVGNIIITLLILFFAIPTIFYMVGCTLVKSDGEWFGKQKKYYGAAILETYINMPKIIPVGGGTYFKVASSYYDVRNDKYTYGSNVLLFGDFGNKDRLEKSILNLEKGISLGEDSKGYVDNLSLLINSYLEIGRKEDSKKLIEEAMKSNNKGVREIAKLNKIVFLAKDGNYNEAIKLCKEELDKKDYEILYLNLLYSYGDRDEYNNELNRIFEKEKIEKTQGYIPSKIKDEYRGDLYAIYSFEDITCLGSIDMCISLWFKEREVGNGTIKGRIISDGKGVPYTLVKISKGQMGVPIKYSNIEDNGEYVYTYSDKDGYYEFKNLSSETYMILINPQGYLMNNRYVMPVNGINDNKFIKGVNVNDGQTFVEDFVIDGYISLKDKGNIVYEEGNNLIFDVPKVEDAKKVVIKVRDKGIGINFISEINSEEDFKIKFPLVEGAQMLEFTDYSEADNKYSIDGRRYVGNYKETTWYISFEYLDDENRVLEQTVPEEFKYKFKSRKLNSGDKLMLDGKYKEAVNWYENELKVKGDSRELLYPLLKYYSDDYRENENGEREKRNLEKFNEYYKRLESLGIENVEKNFFETIGEVKQGE